MSLRRTVGWKNQNFWLEELLTDRFGQVLAETEAQAWTRQKYFKLTSRVLPHYVPRAADLENETQIEIMLQNFWGLHRTDCLEVPKDIWYRIVSRQVPLQPGLTEIARADLVACDQYGNPIIVEIKSRRGVITPLALLLQAAEYIVRLRNSWSFMHAEWEPFLAGFGIPTSVTVPKLFPAVVVAPPEFWRQLLAPRPRFDRSLFVAVLKNFTDSKLPIQFVEIRENFENQSQRFQPCLQIVDLQWLE